MKTKQIKLTLGELFKGYTDTTEGGAFSMNGKLNIRPPYQREYIYKDKQRDAVIQTVLKGLPLQTIYFYEKEDGNYELIDGQQRLSSVFKYMDNQFSLNYRGWTNLNEEEKKKFNNYDNIVIQVVTGTQTELLEWYKIINTNGEAQTNQEMRNSIYSGTWLTDAKKYFSVNQGASYVIGGDYIKGRAIRQEHLETAIKWKADADGDESIEIHMSKHQHDINSNSLRTHFENVIGWVKKTFITYYKEMKKVDWNELYLAYKDNVIDVKELDEKIKTHMMDEDITNKSGIFNYVLTNDEKKLNVRAFNDKIKREVYERQKGKCVDCGKEFDIKEMDADHITPWIEGGKTLASNCQMLCKEDNRRKGSK